MRTVFASIAGCLLAGMMVCVPAWAAGPINRTVAVVNGEMITSYDLSTATAPEMLRSKLDPKKAANRAAIEQLERKVLESMINDIVVVQEAERLKVTVTDNEVDGEISRFREGSKLDEQSFNKELTRQGYTPETFKEQVRKNLLKSRLLSSMVGRKVVVTRDEIAQYYAANKGSIPVAGSGGGESSAVHLAVIVYPPNTDAASWATRIRNGKVSFAQAVRQVSVGPNREQGGDLGTMNINDLAPALVEHLAGLQVGQVSKLFPLEGAQAQVHLIAKGAAAPATSYSDDSLEALAPEIERILREPKMQERYAEYMEQLRKRAVVDIRL